MADATHRLFVRRLDTIGFVDKGDDPKAEVVIFKRHPDSKRAETFDEVGSTARINDEMWDLTYRLQESFRSAVNDADEGQDPAEIMMTSVDQFATQIKSRIPLWAQGKPVEKDELPGLLKRLGLTDEQINKLLDDGGSHDDPAGGGTMDFDITKLDEAAQAEFQKLADRITELEAALEKAEEPEGDGGINKDELPPHVAKALETAEATAKAAEERIQKLEDERETNKYIAKAKALGFTADDWHGMLRKIYGVLDEGEVKRFEEAVKALRKQADESGIYAEIGRGGHGAATETEGAVEEAVKAAQAADPKLNHENAYAKVMVDRPDLRQKLETERLARAPQTLED